MDSKSFNNDQHLTQEELVEYNQGALSNWQMHRLELHLIDCDLCNDALEGISKVDEVALNGSLNTIKSRTNIEEKFEISHKQWLAVAASFILIAVASIVFFIWPSDKTEMIAQESSIKDESSALLKETPKSIVEQVDTVVADIAQEENLLAASTEEQAPSPAPAPAIEPETKEVIAQIAITEPEPNILTENELSGEDTIGESQIAALSSTQEEIDVASGARSKKTAAKSAAPALDEVSEEKLDNVTDANYSPAAPDKGQRSYDRYLKRKLQYPDNAKSNNIEGDVVLQLSIDANGTISNVIITKSLGYGCDEEAVRLVNDGPTWNAATRNGNSISDTISLTIPFKL